ncbi:MAG: hypothetical protein ACOC1P_01990 [Minisyncoccales bacterium]
MNRIKEAQNRENANESFGELVRVQNRFEIHKKLKEFLKILKIL